MNMLFCTKEHFMFMFFVLFFFINEKEKAEKNRSISTSI